MPAAHRTHSRRIWLRISDVNVRTIKQSKKSKIDRYVHGLNAVLSLASTAANELRVVPIGNNDPAVPEIKINRGIDQSSQTTTSHHDVPCVRARPASRTMRGDGQLSAIDGASSIKAPHCCASLARLIVGGLESSNSPGAAIDDTLPNHNQTTPNVIQSVHNNNSNTDQETNVGGSASRTTTRNEQRLVAPSDVASRASYVTCVVPTSPMPHRRDRIGSNKNSVEN
jgi:hypothetical protein